jgi:hypothetical protein
MSACSTMVKEEIKSLADECAWLCSDSRHAAGVKSNATYANMLKERQALH